MRNVSSDLFLFTKNSNVRARYVVGEESDFKNRSVNHQNQKHLINRPIIKHMTLYSCLFFFLVFELRFEQTDVDDPVYIDLTFWTPS